MEFVKDWLNRANKERDNDIYRFFCYFIAFNFSYNENCIEQSEYMRVRQYIHAVCGKFADFDPYGQLPKDAEILKSVKCAKNIKYSVSQTALDQKCVSTLYENIYHVRCNLFHGSKNMRSDRDKKLISESCVLLKYLLSSFLIDNSSD